MQEPNIESDISLNLKWLHQAQFAGNYVAKELGYYQDAGLNVTIYEGGVDRPSIDLVLSGEVDFGIAGADDLIVAVNQEKPVKAIAVIYKLSPVVYFSLSESNITSPYNFSGHIMGVKHGTGTTYSYIAMLGTLGINRSDISEVSVGYDLELLYNKTVDIWPGFRINEPHLAELAGYQVNLVKPEDWGVVMYADVLFTTVDMIENHIDVVQGLVTATLKGWSYAMEYQEETIDIVMDYVSDADRGHQEYMLEESIPLIHTGSSKLGLIEEEVITSMIDILILNEVIDESPSPEDVFTNVFIS